MENVCLLYGTFFGLFLEQRREKLNKKKLQQNKIDKNLKQQKRNSMH